MENIVSSLAPTPCCGECRNALAIADHPHEIACTVWLEYRSREEGAWCQDFEPSADRRPAAST